MSTVARTGESAGKVLSLVRSMPFYAYLSWITNFLLLEEHAC